MVPLKKMKACCLGLAAVLLLSASLGCGNSQQAAQGGKATPVKAMKVLQQNAPVNYEYAGQVQGKNEVKIQARVSGNIVEKLVNGGDIVHRGQPLFRIDQRTYESALYSAQAQLAQSEATLNNSQRDTQRYRELLRSNAISEQTVTTQESMEAQNAASVRYNKALVQKAQDDLNDTVIVSPVDGRMDVNDVSVGTYIQAGTTALATVGSMDPVFVQFSMSENEYLQLAGMHQNGIPSQWGDDVTITLSDGSKYPVSGKVEQVDRSLAQNSGTLTLKASFDNPNKILMPGMFARVKIGGGMLSNAVLVPQRAVQQLLDKSFVTVVGEGDKAESRPVRLGQKIGSYWVVEEGLTSNDTVVVEGLTKIQNGIPLAVTVVTPEELQLSIES